MQLTKSLLSLSTLIHFIVAADTTTGTDLTTLTTNGDTTTTDSSSTSASATLVWVTTTTAGDVATVEVTYSQKFESFYSVVATPSSGSIGLGTLSGTIGTVRTYKTLTVTNTK